jgi:hypothetical protein
MGSFKFRRDLLKHHIRVAAWLPICQQRRKRIRANQAPKNVREPKYFTFCATEAIDVLLLDVHRVIKPSDSGFETVFFFDRDRESVVETQNRIPGAVGFVGDFMGVVLSTDLDLAAVEAEIARADEAGGEVRLEDPLKPPEVELDSYEVRQAKLRREELRRFVQSFPFDIINLDLEEYLFKPSEELPGKVLAALRRIFEWQRLPVRIGKRNRRHLDGFTLMFTTKIGPANLTEDYLAKLRECLQNNIGRDNSFLDLLEHRTGTREVAELQMANFGLFFKIAVPKIIARTLMEQDWYIEPDPGVTIYEFERPHDEGSYTMLHFVMDVRRHNPSREKRLPGEASAEAADAYEAVVRELFRRPEVRISTDKINRDALQASLDEVFRRGDSYEALQ